MKTFNRVPQAIAVVAVVALTSLVTACGGNAYKEPRPVPTTGLPGGLPGPDDDFDPTTPGESFLPAATYAFNLTGLGGAAPEWNTDVPSTDTILKVRVRPGPASQLSWSGGYSNFSAVYGCVNYQVSMLVNGTVVRTVRTSNLKVQGMPSNCSNAVESQTINFSSQLTPGTSDISIQVTAPQYDFYCNICKQAWWMYGNNQFYNPFAGDPYCATQCPVKTVYRNHTVSGSLDVQVNGTSFN